MKYLAAFLVLLLVVCPVAAEEEKVTLRIGVPPKSLRGMQNVSKRAILDAFLVKHPEVKVDPYVRLRMPGPRGEATFYMSMAGDTAPDALYVFGRSTQKYIDQEFLYPLNEYLDRDESKEIRDDKVFLKFLPAISRPMSIKKYLKKYRPDVTDAEEFERNLLPYAKVGAGKGEITLVYGIPEMAAISGLMYRKDLFAQAGLNPEHPPETWDELLEYARKLTFPERGQFGIILPGAQGASWRFANFVWQAGGKMCRQDPKTGKWRLAVDEPEAIRALEFYRELRWGKWTRDGKEMKGCMRVSTDNQLMTHFQQGRAAMTIISTTGDIGGQLQTLDPSQLGLAALPAGPKRRAAMLEGEFWGINALIGGRKKKREATWKYISFLISKESREIRTRTYVEAGFALQVNPKDLKRFGYTAELELMPKAWVDLYDKLVEEAELEPYAPGYAQVSTDILSNIDRILFDENGDPGEVARYMAREANERFFSTQSEELITRREVIANGVFAAFMGLLLVVVGWVSLRGYKRWKSRAKLHASLLIGVETPGKRKMKMRMELLAWTFMLPAVLTILIWKYYPLVSGARLAFMDYRIIGESRFVWLDNFIEAANAPTFWLAAMQTVVYASLALGFGFLMPIILALLLSEIPWAKMLYRTVFYLPAITSGLVVMFIWKMMYDDSTRGVFNTAIRWVTTTSPGRAVFVTLLVSFWMLVACLLLGILLRILHHYTAKMIVIPLLLLLIVAPFWVDAISEYTVLAHLHANWAPEVIGTGDEAKLDKSSVFNRSLEHQWIACVPDRTLAYEANESIRPAPGFVSVLFHGVRIAWQRYTHFPELMGLSPPITYGLTGVVRGLVVILTTLAVVMLMKGFRSASDTKLVVITGGILVFLAGAMALRFLAILIPFETAYAWLQDPTGYWAMMWVIVPGIWAGMGPGCIIYLAALKSIPEDLYEAADVDGAGPLEKAYHVTFQYLKPLIIINFVGAFVGTFHAMQNILVMTGGGPGDRTITLGMDIFFNAFTHLKFGYATAEAWMMGSVLIGFTVYQLRILKKLRFTRAEN